MIVQCISVWFCFEHLLESVREDDVLKGWHPTQLMSWISICSWAQWLTGIILSCVFLESVCECMCVTWFVCVQYYREGVQQQIKDTCGSGKERMDRRWEEGNNGQSRGRCSQETTFPFLKYRKSDIPNKIDQKTKSVQHYSACSQLWKGTTELVLS